MKFAFLSSYAHRVLDPAETRVSGGAELQVALLARELARRGHEVLVIGGEDGQPADRMLDGVRCVSGGRFQTGGLADTLRALPVVFGHLRRFRPDFTAILGWTSWLFFLLAARWLYGTRLLFICGLDTEVNGEFRRANPVRGALFEWGIRLSDGRFAMSELQERLMREAGLTCGFYRNLILPRPAPRTGPKDIDLLWLARCQPIKRPHLFLDLAEALPEARCLMVCVREDVALWETVAQRASTLPNVEFRERVPYHEAQGIYDRAQLFVNTSEWEGFANAFIQAGQGETALLTLAVNSDGVLDKFHAGICVEGSMERLIAAARELLADPGRLHQLQAGAARFVEEWHDNALNTDRFLAGLPQ